MAAEIRPTGTDEGRRPPQTTMGLLDYITAHSLDEDYAHVSARRRATGEQPAPSRAPLAALVVLALFGLLAATALVQTSRNAVAAQSGRESLVAQIKARSARLDARRVQVVQLRSEVDALQQLYLEATDRGRALSDRLSRLAVQVGSVEVEGPGVTVLVDDAPGATSASQEVLDKDLQKLVNGLWQAGAEAVAVNGQRVTNLTAIRQAGSRITVNYRSISPPYVVEAIGNPDALPARFIETQHGAEWLDLQATYGLQFDLTTKESVRVPAADRLTLRYATTGTQR